jgi:hypothetical protein
MLSSGMLRRVALVITDVSEECSASMIRATRIGEIGTLAVTNVGGYTFLRNVVVTRATRMNTSDDDIFRT